MFHALGSAPHNAERTMPAQSNPPSRTNSRTKSRTISRAPRPNPAAPLAIAITGMAIALSAVGCVGYATHDPLLQPETSPGEFHGGLQRVLATGLRWSITRFPPTLSAEDASVGMVEVNAQSPVAISLPAEFGLTPEAWSRIARDAGPDVLPLNAASKGRPIYRVGRVALRGSRAEMEVHRPTPAGAYQTLTLDLELTSSGWSVRNYRLWTAPAADIPPLNFAPGAIGPDGASTRPEAQPGQIRNTTSHAG